MRGHSRALTVVVALVAATSFQACAQPPVVDSADPAYQDSTGAEPVPVDSYPVEEQAPLEQSAPPLSEASEPPQPAAPAGTTREAAIFNQNQQLQQEIAELRGMVEELNHQVKQLQQQRLDDYTNIDRRLSAMSGGAAAPADAAPADGGQSSAAEAPAEAGAAPVSTGDEQSDYTAAAGLVKAKRYDDALAAFRQYLAKYPDGERAPNAYFWQGEIYAVKGSYEQARNAYAKLLERFPKHTKVPDAMYKVGKVYHQMGNTAKAKEWLQRVQKQYPNSTAAKLAADYARNELG